MNEVLKKLLALAMAASCLAQPAWAEQQSEERKRAQIHADLGAGYLGMGKLGIALEELKVALESDSRYAPAYNYLGLVYMELREDAKAEENFQRALSLDPVNSEANNNYGWFLCQRKRPADSIAYFTKALKNPLYETPEKAYLNAGICSVKKGDDQAAEEFLLRAIKYQPPSAQAFYNLAELNFRRGKYVDALYYLDRNMKIAQPNAESLWLGARIAHRTRNRDAEANYGLQLRKRFPESREEFAFRNGLFDETINGEGQK